MAENGVDAVYLAFDVHPGRSRQIGSAIRTLGFGGVNLTRPFKETILTDLDELAPSGREAQAVNVVLNRQGHLTGHNTDGEGFVRALEGEFGPSASKGSALILGAGGTGRAVAAALAGRGATRVVLLNRSLEKAKRAAGQLQELFPSIPFVVDELTPKTFLRLSESTDMIVNCTAAVAAPMVEAFDVSRLGPEAIWCDINYWMRRPPLLDACRRRGLRVLDGLPMLAHQGALSFELFTGRVVEPALIFQHLSSSGCRD